MISDTSSFEALRTQPTGTVTPRTVVRLKTSFWYDPSALHMKKTITVLRRKSIGRLNLFDDHEASNFSTVSAAITNINSCPDGLYELVLNHVSRDWSGHVDDWDYRLVPYKKENANHE